MVQDSPEELAIGDQVELTEEGKALTYRTADLPRKIVKMENKVYGMMVRLERSQLKNPEKMVYEWWHIKYLRKKGEGEQ